MKRLILLSILVVASFGCSDGGDQGLSVVHLGYIPSASGAPVFHAVEDGCLDDFSLEFHRYETSNLLAVDVARNQVQVALVVGLAQVLDQLVGQADAVEVLAILESTPCLVVPRGTSEAFEAYLSEGERIVGSWPGSVFPQYTREVLGGLGLSTENIYISPIKPPIQISQLTKGEVDALFTLEPICLRAEVDGVGQYVYQERNLLAEFVIRGDYFPGGAVVASSKGLKEIPGLRKDLSSCLSGPATEAAGHKPTTVAALAKFANLGPEYALTLPIRQPIVGEDMASEELNRLIEDLIRLGQLQKEFELPAYLASQNSK